MSIARYCICYKAYLASMGQIFKAVSVVIGTTFMPSNIDVSNKIICMM